MPHIHRTVRLLALTATATLTALVSCAGARAGAPADPLGFHFDSSALSVNENAGVATIEVERSPQEAGQAAQVRYITLGEGYDPSTSGAFMCGATPCTAVDKIDFHSVKSELDFGAGQTNMSFRVPIVDHGTDTVPKTIRVSLFGPSSRPEPIGLADPSTATLTILNNDPVPAPTPGDPLAQTTASKGNPLAGVRFFVDPDNEPAEAAHQYPALRVIAREPGTARFGSFSYGSIWVPDIGIAVSRYLTRAAAQEPGTVPMLATYRLVDGHCGHWADPPADKLAYHNFIERFAQGIGSYRAVLFLEMDSLITTPCLTSQGVAIRMLELNDAINILTADCPHLVIYLDAGAADALPARACREPAAAGGGVEDPGLLPQLDALRLDRE